MAEEDETPQKKLERDGNERLAACRIWKSLWDLDLRECYFFASPQRQRQIQSYSPPPQQRLLDAAELNTDLAMELCGDFATEVINTYMPAEAPLWCERDAGMYLSAEKFESIKKDVRKQDEQIFRAIKASNFYSELSKAFDPDLAIGTVAMWIDPPRPGAAIRCKAGPLMELEINLGPDGEIDDRYLVRHTRNCYLERLLGEEIWDKVSDEIKKTCKEKPQGRTELRWAFWRKWDRFDDEVWQHVVMIKQDLVHDVELVGEGSCPLIVMRWNPNPDWPWGHGPLMQGMPSLRQIDELEAAMTDNADLALRPPVTYPDDSFTEIENGLEPGMAYPVRPGTAGDVKSIYQVPPLDPAKYAYEAKEKRLRRMFFVDFPQQTGDTPPTLGQWLDEMARAQRRIGRPGLPFWAEGPAKIFLRFKYLLEKAGAIQPLKVDGKQVSLMPYNPSQRAAEQQEIAMAVHGLQLCSSFFPEEFKMLIDGKQTMEALLDKLRVVLVKWRDPSTVNAAVDKIQKLIQTQQVDPKAVAAGLGGGSQPGASQ